MLVFQKVRWKNFLSTGDKWTEIDFQKNRTTLIVGHNGAGKSTMLDAISFGLFGKGHRNIKNDQLVNSINGKHTLVEVEMIAHGQQYKIVRGFKPRKFEIWRDGIMINQDSHAKEYQKILEQNILKLNHKSFHQIVVLGSSSFIPFMQLSNNARREVIEELLDIGVFSKMNMLMREKNSGLRELAKHNGHNLNIIETKLESQLKYIQDITSINDNQRAKYEEEIISYQTEIEQLVETNKSISANIEELSKGLTESTTNTNSKKQQLLQFQAQFNTQRNAIVKEARFYETNDKCPTCSQVIEESLKEEKLVEGTSKAKELQSALDKIEGELSIVNQSIEHITLQSQQVAKSSSELSVNNNTITRLQSQISSGYDSIKELESKTGNLSTANDEMSTLKSEQSKLIEEKLDISDKVAYNSVISEMLKDTGIKTKIIKQYVPVINKLVNNYLQVLDFFVSFELDENFSETIRSRHRDSFSYDSFSEGEKQRIDLALLFTWRAVAKMKNSVATNLLILDETFDSSLDYDGVDNLMKILYTLDNDTNVFVISHKTSELNGKFDSTIRFSKERNFSTCSVIE